MKTMRHILSVLLIAGILSIGSTAAHAAAAVGHAVFREFAAPNREFFGHAGIVSDLYSNGSIEYVVHALEALDGVVFTEFEGFLKTGFEYYGSYYIPGNYNYNNVYNHAEDLAFSNARYTLTTQMVAEQYGSTDVIYPDEIARIRCDGVVEYCFEREGIEVLSNTYNGYEYWNISDRSDYPHHGSIGHSPTVQKNIMTQSSS